ncbi:MAG TPA: ATP-dependent Clp protease proteolytic subunit [Acidimicrobiales bacterium]|jgi:ATP-dependent Clp protease protease subunit|nr:ATP-dependent Clp protease proteolytic subunit [Acidimicrobiales bacterium]
MNASWYPPTMPPSVPPPPGQGAPPQGDWADAIRSRLFEHRTILIRGVLDDAAATQAAAELMTLDATGDSRITVHLDAGGGGTLEGAFAVMDVIDLLGVPVHVLCVGRAEGPAVGVLAVGSRRASTPHARIRLSDPETTAAGSASELARWAEHHTEQLRRFHQRVAQAVSRPVGEVARDFASGRYLNPQDAVAYGLIDEIATPRGAVFPLPGRTVGFQP